MAEDEAEENLERDEEFEAQDEASEDDSKVIRVSGMYEEWFLDYASYVILERAVPHLNDGLKPVQRRLLHSMKEMDDGRYNKVANIIGNTMKYHPHGDASIGDALVQLGQKEMLIDMQGNWGNIFTGDRAAASRYIEARPSRFAHAVVFNPKTTEWQTSYDGRNKEPVTLPIKFPLLLAQGVEGIAVGLACKMLPHNFNELIDGSIAVLKGKKPKLVPDFPTGGMADCSNYNDGLRGGKIKVRARIQQLDKKTLLIKEIPFGTNTGSLIDSILKANDRGKIKIKKVEDNTAEEVEVAIHLATGVSPDKMIDALYAFTDCEVSISPNATVIENDRPQFLGVSEMLRLSTERTVALLKLELEIRKRELQEQWHFASLEKIFIENRIYRDIEECETWEAILEAIHKGLKPHIKHLVREVTDEDVTRLTEIRIKRISRFDAFKADTLIARLEDEIAAVQNNLDNLIEFAIDYFKDLKAKFGKGRERKTEIKSFDTIDRTKVAVANAKLMVNYAEGFIGSGLKRSESEVVADCSDIDDIIVIRQDGMMVVTKISQKAFVGKDILHVGVWKKGDNRTVYNLIYRDGTKGNVMVKRFSVTSITRDKEYPLTKGNPSSKILYLTANPNGEAEVVNIILKMAPNLRKPKFDFDFGEIAIKGRGAGGNILSRHPVNKIVMKEQGVSTLSARKIWFDDAVQRLNSDGRGELLGEFAGEDKILTIMQSGHYKLHSFDLSSRFDEDLVTIEKWSPEKPVSCIYYDPAKEYFYVKRFLVEETDRKVCFISEDEGAYMEIVSTDWKPMINLQFDKRSNDREDEEINMEEFISVKGLKAQGNRLSAYKIKTIDVLEPLDAPEMKAESVAKAPEIPEEPVEVELELDVPPAVPKEATPPQQTASEVEQEAPAAEKAPRKFNPPAKKVKPAGIEAVEQPGATEEAKEQKPAKVMKEEENKPEAPSSKESPDPDTNNQITLEL